MLPVSIDVFHTLKMLTPYDINLAKLQYGNKRDGCYILADSSPGGDIVSFGISNDVMFETDMARQGRRVFMYDHTISALPSNHANFRFEKHGICSAGAETAELSTLEQHLDRIGRLRDGSILKMDVEGHEWDTFATSSDDVLGAFDQIVVELHWLENLCDKDFRSIASKALSNLNAQFTMFHVHANNCCEIVMVEGFAVACVIEVSFIKSSLVHRTPSKSLYPSGLNKSNYPGRHDLPLLFFPFMPTTVDNGSLEALISRINLEATTHT